jgi:hypothetical protein
MLWYHIELNAPTNSTQKLKLIGKGGQFTYTPASDSEAWRRVVLLFLQRFVYSPHLESKAYQDSRDAFFCHEKRPAQNF